MKSIKTLLLIVAVAFTVAACKKDKAIDDSPSDKRMVVGYHYSWQGQIDVNTMRWDDLSHLLLAFLLVNADGTVKTGNIHNVKQIVEAAHKHGVKVLASTQHEVMGSKVYGQAVKNHKETLADNIINYVRNNNLDGFDIDFEDFDSSDPQIIPSLLSFVELLHNKKDPGMIQSCAVRAWDVGYTTKWHEYFDIINIMTYDFAGPWSAEGPTARFELCVERVLYWQNTMKAPAHKLTMGVPFYGISWNAEDGGNGKAYSYQAILDKYPDRDVANNDQIDHLHYNGKATIVKKAQWAKANNIGGIMIWNVAQDAKSDKESLLKAIGDVMRSN